VGRTDQPTRPSATLTLTVVALAGLAIGLGVAWDLMFFGPTPLVFIDLDYYRAALATVASHQPLYAALPYPPIAVLAIAGLGGLPVDVGNQLWTAATMVGCVALPMVIAKRSLQAKGEARPRTVEYLVPGAMLALMLLCSSPMISQLTNGQLTLLIIALTFADVARVMPRKAEGVLVGLAGAIKLTPLIFVPYYLVTGQRRQAATATASFAGFTLLGFALFPSDSVFFWTHLGKNDQFGDPTRVDNLSIQATLARWLPAVNDLPLAWVIIGLAVAVFALLRARRHFRRGEWMESVLTVGAASVVIAPIAWPHYLVWVVLAALWLVLRPDRRGKLVGLGIYLVYSLPYLLLAFPAAKAGDRVGMAVIEVAVVVPVLIGLFGLPRRSAAVTPVPASSPTDADVEHPEPAPRPA